MLNQELRGVYLSVSEAAKLIGVTPGRINQMIRAGEIAGAIAVDERCYILPKRSLKPHEKPRNAGRPRIGTAEEPT